MLTSPRETTGGTASIEKALDVCEALSGADDRGMSLSELSRALRLPPSTVHRLVSKLKRRGYVRQDEETARYRLSLKMLDLSFRVLGRSELRLHAYPVLREYALRTGARCFVAIPRAGEVTYVWSSGPDEVAMHTSYGREMPGHCAIYFDRQSATRRLSCLRLSEPDDALGADDIVVRLGSAFRAGERAQRLICTCAPIQDYLGREVARVGVFEHAADETRVAREHTGGAWELARLISLRLGYLAMPAVPAQPAPRRGRSAG